MPLVCSEGRHVNLTAAQHLTYQAVATSPAPPTTSEVARQIGKDRRTALASLLLLERLGVIFRPDKTAYHPTWKAKPEVPPAFRGDPRIDDLRDKVKAAKERLFDLLAKVEALEASIDRLSYRR